MTLTGLRKLTSKMKRKEKTEEETNLTNPYDLKTNFNY
jgi:hypothetical protein